ncbi:MULTISPECIES: hypothetical protein [unclassified Haladaptatus]|uniref:hypothetical protein n=1 Tax=unclassified Haladaptatus TaxID=2622732 RepID=UPI00209BEDA5|nr:MULTISPECIES: hypothetical protein [unclassified Haladaptatus]MCO8246739.1 hypothetical protein [Haladaptatus sp. AB643]MCO8256387.1 hypothetical protein [Haladaptatus sp. AB618]
MTLLNRVLDVFGRGGDDDAETYQCIRCGETFDREYYECPACGVQHGVARVDGGSDETFNS